MPTIHLILNVHHRPTEHQPNYRTNSLGKPVHQTPSQLAKEVHRSSWRGPLLHCAGLNENECTYIDWLCALSLCLGLYVSVRRNPCTQLNYGGDFTFKVIGLYQTGWLKHKLRASASEVSQKCDLGTLNLRFRLMRELNETPNRFLVSIFKNTGLRRYKLAGESCSVLLTEHSFFRLHHSDRGGCQQAIWNSLGDV